MYVTVATPTFATKGLLSYCLVTSHYILSYHIAWLQVTIYYHIILLGYKSLYTIITSLTTCSQLYKPPLLKTTIKCFDKKTFTYYSTCKLYGLLKYSNKTHSRSITVQQLTTSTLNVVHTILQGITRINI